MKGLDSWLERPQEKERAAEVLKDWQRALSSALRPSQIFSEEQKLGGAGGPVESQPKTDRHSGSPSSQFES